MKYMVIVEGEPYLMEMVEGGRISLNGHTIDVDFSQIGDQGLYSMLVANESFEALVEQASQDRWHVLMDGYLFEVEIYDERLRRLREQASPSVPEGTFEIRAPMPGLVVGVPVEPGQHIERGQNVLILESMKMENELKSPRAGTVASVEVKKGDSVDQNQVLLIVN